MFQVSPVEAEYGQRAFEGVTQFQDRYVYPNKKIAIFHGDQDWDKKYADGVVAAAQKAGWQVVMNDQVSYDTTDWAPILTKIRAEQPAAIVCSFLSVDGISSFVEEFMKSPTPSLLDVSYLVTLSDTQDALGTSSRASWLRERLRAAEQGERRLEGAVQGDVRDGRPSHQPASAYDS